MAEKEVNFEKYCPLCVYQKLNEDQDPCDDCLCVCYREDSHKPEYFKAKDSNDTAG